MIDLEYKTIAVVVLALIGVYLTADHVLSHAAQDVNKYKTLSVQTDHLVHTGDSLYTWQERMAELNQKLARKEGATTDFEEHVFQLAAAAESTFHCKLIAVPKPEIVESDDGNKNLVIIRFSGRYEQLLLTLDWIERKLAVGQIRNIDLSVPNAHRKRRQELELTMAIEKRSNESI